MPKRKVLLVDDEVAVLLTMKAVLEISGFDVDTATTAREGRIKIRKGEYQMVITDMRMESDAAGREVIHAARTANYHPAVALLTAHPVEEGEWQDMGADRMLVKPMQTPVLIRQLEKLLDQHAAKLQRISFAASSDDSKAAAKAPQSVLRAAGKPTGVSAGKSTGKRPADKAAAKKTKARKTIRKA